MQYFYMQYTVKNKSSLWKSKGLFEALRGHGDGKYMRWVEKLYFNAFEFILQNFLILIQKCCVPPRNIALLFLPPHIISITKFCEWMQSFLGEQQFARERKSIKIIFFFQFLFFPPLTMSL